MRIRATLLLGALAAVTLAAAGPGAVAGGTAGKVRCSLAGKHYWGTTSQRKPLCFTLSRDGTKLVEYSYGLHDNCGNGGSRVKSSKGRYITTLSGGKFKFEGAGGLVFFKGVVRGSTASGTLRNFSLDQNFNTCDTGVVGWTAQRKK